MLSASPSASTPSNLQHKAQHNCRGTAAWLRTQSSVSLSFSHTHSVSLWELQSRSVSRRTVRSGDEAQGDPVNRRAGHQQLGLALDKDARQCTWGTWGMGHMGAEPCYQCRAQQCSRNRSSFGNLVRERHRCMFVCVAAKLASPCSQAGRQPVALSAPTQSHFTPARHRFTGSPSSVCLFIHSRHARHRA